MPDEPTQLPPVEAEIYSIAILGDNTLRVYIVFTDGTNLGLDFTPDSPVAHELRELIERGMNDTLRRLGQRGLSVTGFTAPDAEDDQE